MLFISRIQFSNVFLNAIANRDFTTSVVDEGNINVAINNSNSFTSSRKCSNYHYMIFHRLWMVKMCVAHQDSKTVTRRPIVADDVQMDRGNSLGKRG